MAQRCDCVGSPVDALCGKRYSTDPATQREGIWLGSLITPPQPRELPWVRCSCKHNIAMGTRGGENECEIGRVREKEEEKKISCFSPVWVLLVVLFLHKAPFPDSPVGCASMWRGMLVDDFLSIQRGFGVTGGKRAWCTVFLKSDSCRQNKKVERQIQNTLC